MKKIESWPGVKAIILWVVFGIGLGGCGGSSGSGAASSNTPADVAPSAPTAIGATAKSASEITLNWRQLDSAGVSGIEVYVLKSYPNKSDTDEDYVTTLPADAQTFLYTGLLPGTEYCCVVKSVSASGKKSASSEKMCATTPAIDTTPPSVPVVTNIVASQTKVAINWSAATDNVAVKGYNVESDGVVVATLPANVLSFVDSGLKPLTQHCYRIVSFDTSGNPSADSSPPACITTLAAVMPVDLPAVIDTSPLDGAEVAQASLVISATFSKDMDPAAFESASVFALVDSKGWAVPGSIIYDPALRKMTFTSVPVEKLSKGEKYVATISKNVSDVDGNKLPEDYVWKFSISMAP